MNIEKEKIRENPTSQVPVFDPHRWLIDFEPEKTVKAKAPPSGPTRRRSKDEMMMWNLVSSIVDFLFVTAFACLFLWSIGQLLETSIKGTVFGLWRLSPVGTVLLSFSFLWVYHVAMPALFTYTLGQWACQITRTPQEISVAWVLKSTFRLMTLFLTGFIVLPLFSWASGFDLEGNLSGLKLYSKS